MKISVSSYSFSQYIKAGKLTQKDCVAKAAELGFDAIEFTDLASDGLDGQKKLAEKIRTLAEKLDISVNAYTIGASLYKPTAKEREAEVERLKGELDVASILGASVMRHDVCYSLGNNGPSRSFDLMLPYLAESAVKVTEYAETLGIKTCTENHGYIAQDSDRVERLFNAVNRDNYGLLVDIGNFSCVDEDNAVAVSRVAPYAIHAHVKDMRKRSTPMGPEYFCTRGGNYLCGTVIGEGDVPIKKCLSILKNAGYSGNLSIEYEGTEDCISGITKGYANLKRILTELSWN